MQRIYEGGAAVCSFCFVAGGKALTADRRTRPRCGGYRRRCAPRDDGLAPKGGNAILMEPVRSMQKQEFGCFNAPKGGNADLTLHYKYFNQSGQKFTGRSPRRCAPRDDGLAPKGGNAVLTHREIVVFLINGKIYVSMPRRAVMLF